MRSQSRADQAPRDGPGRTGAELAAAQAARLEEAAAAEATTVGHGTSAGLFNSASQRRGLRSSETSARRSAGSAASDATLPRNDALWLRLPTPPVAGEEMTISKIDNANSGSSARGAAGEEFIQDTAPCMNSAEHHDLARGALIWYNSFPIQRRRGRTDRAAGGRRRLASWEACCVRPLHSTGST